MNVQLKADPQQILIKSGDMKSIRGNLSSVLGQIEDKVHSLTNTWESDASAAFQAQFNKVHKDIEEMLNIAGEYSRDLEEIAQNYIAAEQRVQQAASALPGDVFTA